MHEIDGISISDINMDSVCLNCRHWQANVQLYGAAKGVICMLTKEHTQPTDTCSQFSPNMTADDLQNPNRYHEKSQKVTVFKRFRF
ncbi:hypothetical protein [Methanobrevibacter sp.]|uniref:hypothetical protein n=1 Tax=Methanobrevibacter sp. TaxID=66852 RepID=UPI00388F9479